MNLDGQDSPITIYIQHPIPIPAPGDKNKSALKPMKLTTKVCQVEQLKRKYNLCCIQEQKKMRRLRRKEALQDKRDRIRMGLLPPDAPKGSSRMLLRIDQVLIFL